MWVHDGMLEWATDKTCWSGCFWARHTSCPLLLGDGCHFTTWLYTLPITRPFPPPLQHEADGALRKARLLQAQRQEEYEKAKVSTSRLEEEQNVGGGGAATAKQLEKRRRLEEEALQKVKSHLQWFMLHLLSITVICFLPFIAHINCCGAAYKICSLWADVTGFSCFIYNNVRVGRVTTSCLMSSQTGLT